MKKNILVPAILITILALLIFFVPSYGYKLQRLFSDRGGETSENDLALENQNLKAELAVLENIKRQLPDRLTGYIPAIVYSRYPFSVKNEFLVNVGKNAGVSENKAVVFAGMLIGKVEKVFEDTALVQTIFDSRLEFPVRIGSRDQQYARLAEGGVEALFSGGSLPLVALIQLKSEVQKGDIVYSVSENFPYGLPLGEIEEIKISADRLFQEATLRFTYDINAAETVSISRR